MFSNRTRASIFMAFALLAMSVPMSAEIADKKERWLETRIAGQPAGYIHEVAQASADGGIITSGQSRTVMNRLGSKVEIAGSIRTEETLQGLVKTLSAEISSSQQKIVMEGRVEEQTLLLTISTGGKSYERKLPLSETLLGPEGARRITVEKLRHAGDTVSYTLFSPELGSLHQVTRTCKLRDSAGLQIEESSTALPGSSAVWLDESGRTKRIVQQSPFGEIEMRIAPKELALAAAGTGAELPAESYQRSLVRSNIRLPQEREIERIRVRITHKNPTLGWPSFADARQKVISQSKEEVILEIRQEAAGQPEQPTPEFLAANALFQSDDAAVAAMAKQAIAGQATSGQATTKSNDIFALRAWTSRNMRFDAGIAVAPASEVARNRAGTCFGYSVLLGAMARAVGIPSRLKMGFVYTGGIWGGHAWIEAFQNGQWVAVDAAVPSPRQADAARISFFTSSLAEGAIAGIGDLARMFGNVEIAVLAYQIRGQSKAVPADAQPFQIIANVYTNPWLGVRVSKPKEYTFAKLDAVWPETTIVEMQGGDKQRISLHQISVPPEQYLARNGIIGPRRPTKISGLPGFVVGTGGKAVLIVPDRGTTWVVLAETPSAAKLLRKAGAWLSFRQP